jgi:predicted nucleic acid-binding protein
MMKKRSLPVLTSILRIIELHSEMVGPVSFAQPVCSDPDDDKFLEAALAAHAGYVVSGDAALLNVKLYRGIEIVRPARFLTLLLR